MKIIKKAPLKVKFIVSSSSALAKHSKRLTGTQQAMNRCWVGGGNCEDVEAGSSGPSLHLSKTAAVLSCCFMKIVLHTAAMAAFLGVLNACVLG